MNMSEKYTSILRHLDWAAVDEEHVPGRSDVVKISDIALTIRHIVRAPIEPDSGEYRSAGQQARYDKRRMAQDALEQVREELFSGEWDGLVLHFIFFSWCLETGPRRDL